MERLEAGEVWSYPTPYGGGFFSLEYIEDSKKYEVDLRKKILVRQLDLLDNIVI